ncbi:MAG: hypothetical protein H0W99_05515 [Acidobacteria bacterium]|nr:hypothetical protein [Acidobacteriota bacterium]
MEFSNILKGQITQSLLKTLMERVGYRVTRLGVEELFGEIKYLSLERYMALGLPLNLRYLPDLLVADPDMLKVWLVEVKFRREFNEQAIDSLYRDLKKQREHWPNSYAVIMIGKPFVEGGRFHQDCLRVLWPALTERLNRSGEGGKKIYRAPSGIDVTIERSCEDIWTSLPTLNLTFQQFERVSDGFASADLVTSTIKDLSKL